MMRNVFGVVVLLLLAACSPQSGAPKNTNWALLGNSAEMQHHSDLSEINKDTIGKLELAWWTEMPTPFGLVGNPLIQDGVVFQGGPGGSIFANDVRTGKLLWQFEADYDLTNASRSTYSAKNKNRGIALYKDKVIIAANCRLFAVDQKRGTKKWEAQSCDPSQMFAITQAPRVGDGMVFIGQGCGDSGSTRGFVDAFDADSGKRKWRFYTVPGDPSKKQDSALYDDAAKTWGTDWYSKSQGCGSPWDALTFDPKLHQLYIGTAAPGPSDPTKRAADAKDELFAAAVVAVDSRTGAYKWHFTQTPNDAWDYDSSMGIMVADVPVGGASRRVVLSVPKNGFAYTIDAETGKFISGGAYTKINWAKGLDAAGRPILDEAAMYWKKPGNSAIVWPNAMGAHGWEALAFDPKSNLLFIPSLVAPMEVKQASGQFTGVYFDFLTGDTKDPKYKAYGEVVAWDPVANSVKWRAPSAMPMNGGLLHTAGDLVFQGMGDGQLVAFDAQTGKALWNRQTGGAMRAAPSTVMVDGEQYLIVATGNGTAAANGQMMQKFATTVESRTAPRLLAFKIGGSAAYPPLAEKSDPTPEPPAARQSAALAKAGSMMFEGYGCNMCHGADGGNSINSAVPNLNRAPPADIAMLKTVVVDGALASRGMPKFDGLSDADIKALYAYIINEAWRAHDRDKAAETKSK